jgi:indole-3-glycerol phosphate synthase
VTYLDQLIAGTRRRVEELKSAVTPEALEQRISGAEPARGFAAALRRSGFGIIAEIKRASPSAGLLDRDLSARDLALSYARGGAAAISVLTEPDFFRGSLEDMVAARTAGLPVLRKDFIVDPLQVLESRAWGADAVLLVVRVIGDELELLVRGADSLDMDALVEVHNERDLERALAAGATLIGINHRDLTTFEVDPERTAKLAPMVPAECVVVALSGVEGVDDVRAARAAGVTAVLIGELVVTAHDPAATLAELLDAS